jgi:ATP-dependent Clp protease ATP-binding subunit ClpA/post-segregation antitoxin (ccd killing protein)
MPKINVYLPDDLAEAVRESGVPVSTICQRALEQAVRRVTAIRATVLSDLTAEDVMARLAHFTVRARTAVSLAAEQAQVDGAQVVDTEHLLGGLLAEGGNLAVHVLGAMEIEAGQVARDLARQPAAAPAVAADGGARTFSGCAANALALAVTEAMALGHNYTGCEHVLLGLVTEPDGTAGQVLRTLGAEPPMTRRAVSAALAGYVHLRAEAAIGRAAGAEQAGDSSLAAGGIGQEVSPHVHAEDLKPLVIRIERLEERAGLSAGYP